MSSPGTKPKDPNLRLLQGTGHRPIPELPELSGLELEPPDWLSAGARELWMRHVEELEKNDMVADVDRVRLALYYSMEARAIALEQSIAKEESAVGSVQITGRLVELRQINGLLVKMANNLGLTPTERARGGKARAASSKRKETSIYGV